MFDPLNIVLRVSLSLIFLFTATKLLTNRSLARLTYFDYIATTTLGTIGGNLAFNINITIPTFILSITLITIIIMLISFFSMKYKPIRKFLAGEPTILIQDGKILESNLSKLHYSFDYLAEQLRDEGVFDSNRVELAILEPNGEFSVKLKPEKTNSANHALNTIIKEESFATEIILDGLIIEKNLYRKDVDKEWLYQELNKRGINNIDKICFAALSSNGKLYLDLYNY